MGRQNLKSGAGFGARTRDALDIAFIIVLAFLCLVIPTVLQGRILVSWDASGSGIDYTWDAAGYAAFLLIIIGFFSLIIYHSIKNH